MTVSLSLGREDEFFSYYSDGYREWRTSVPSRRFANLLDQGR